MRMSDQTDKLTEALAKASAEFQPIETNRTGAHQARYADLATVLRATRPALAANGLALMQLPKRESGALLLVSRLAHASGQWIECDYPLALEATKSPQAIGSALTYARRYVAAAMLNVAAELDDDDAEAAELDDAAPAGPQMSSAALKREEIWAEVETSFYNENENEEDAKRWLKSVKSGALTFKGVSYAQFPGKWKGALEEFHSQQVERLRQRDHGTAAA